MLIPWHRIGDLILGESKASVEREYGPAGHGYHVLIHNQGIVQGYYRLHNSRVYVTFWDGRVNDLDFTTRYYRTTNGFGIGSTIPLGPCYRTATNLCEHRWHGFVWNAWKKETSCHCWFKATKPLKPASAIFIRNGRVSQIYLAQKFVD